MVGCLIPPRPIRCISISLPSRPTVRELWSWVFLVPDRTLLLVPTTFGTPLKEQPCPRQSNSKEAQVISREIDGVITPQPFLTHPIQQASGRSSNTRWEVSMLGGRG